MQRSFKRLSSETIFRRADKEATCLDATLKDEQQLYEPTFIYYDCGIPLSIKSGRREVLLLEFRRGS